MWRLRQSNLFLSVLLSNNCRKYHGISQLFGIGKDFSDGFFNGVYNLWMIVGLTESVVVIALNSLTVIAFCRDRNLRKRPTYLVISLAVADILSGGTAPFDLFDNIGAMCNFWRHNTKYRYRIPVVLLIWFLGCSLTNMTVVSLEHLNATFWPFRHCAIKKSVYWVLIIAIWLIALLFSCALIMIYYYTYKANYSSYAWI